MENIMQEPIIWFNSENCRIIIGGDGALTIKTMHTHTIVEMARFKDKCDQKNIGHFVTFNVSNDGYGFLHFTVIPRVSEGHLQRT
jgi:hypothetical protein